MLGGVRRLFTPGKLAAAALILAALVVGILLITPASNTYIFLPDEAHPVAPKVEVKGGKDPRGPGGIYFVDVIVRKATVLERLFPGIREGSTLVPASVINPSGVSESARRQGNLQAMARSQDIAAAVALHELGYEVDAVPIGALVTDVVPDAPAAGKLQPGDIVIAVDGKPVETPDDLRAAISSRRPGAEVALTVRRGSGQEKVTITTRADPREPGRAVVGVLTQQASNIKLPIPVMIDAGNVGGPSAGLAFALDVLEELGRDVDRGCKVAATGEIGLDGSVGPVGGLEQKTIGARRAGAKVFVVPAGDNAEEARRYADGLRIIPVRTFQQALRQLATVPRCA